MAVLKSVRAELVEALPSFIRRSLKKGSPSTSSGRTVIVDTLTCAR